MIPESTSPSSLPTLLRELRDETTTLLRQEVALAKTELKDNASKFGGHVTQIAIGGFIAYAGAIVLLIGLGQLLGTLLARAGLNPAVAQWLAPTLVGLTVAIIGAIMLSRARHALTSDSLVPRETIDSLKTNKQWAQRKLSHT